MEIVKCSKGHFYDKSLGQCPMCAAEAAKAGGQASVFADPVIPQGSFQVDEIGETMPGETIQNNQSMNMFKNDEDIGTTVQDKTSFVHGDSLYKDPDDFAPTQFAGSLANAAFDPVVGWLVCTEGINRGRDYRLHSDINSIGRHKGNDICIENDDTISKMKDTLVTYDPKSMSFFVAKGEGRNLIYKNDVPVLQAVILEPYDILSIGNTKLVFVPLCSDKFNW